MLVFVYFHFIKIIIIVLIKLIVIERLTALITETVLILYY